MAKDLDKYFSQGCNIIEVTSLSIIQRIVYALLDKKSSVCIHIQNFSCLIVHTLSLLFCTCDVNTCNIVPD